MAKSRSARSGKMRSSARGQASVGPLLSTVALSAAAKAAASTVAALTPLEEIIATLQAFTSRDLAADPPKPAEKLGVDLGIGNSNLDRFIRPWINKRFRVPKKMGRLPPGAINGDTTFKQLCEAAGV